MSRSTTLAYRTETGRDQKTRIQFITARNKALLTQRDETVHRLSVLRDEVRTITTAITTDTMSDAAAVLKVLERHSTTERKLVEEITRLNGKIRPV